MLTGAVSVCVKEILSMKVSFSLSLLVSRRVSEPLRCIQRILCPADSALLRCGWWAITMVTHVKKKQSHPKVPTSERERHERPPVKVLDGGNWSNLA